MGTHDVHNQAYELVDYNLFSGDLALAEAVEREGGAWGRAELSGFGKLAGLAETIEHGRLANENPPVLSAFDRFGHRINVVDYHPSYHHLMSLSMANQLHSQPWNDERSGAFVVRSAKTYMMSQIESGHGCPITMTFAAVPALRHSDSIAAEWIPRLTAGQYDGRNMAGGSKTACTAGMAMTEKQGGSDVRANTTRALKQSDGTYRLVGHKWFCSAPMSDVFLTLANDDVGLSCFLVPRWTPDGRPNAMNLQRLKNKLGNHSNASTEIEYEQAYGVLLGQPGRGVRTIIDMVSHTRLDCVVASAGLMRQALVQAAHHAKHRSTFGKRLVEHVLMQNVLADLAVEVEAATALGMRLARAYDDARTDPVQAAFARIATAIGKYWVCKRVPWVAYEAMECHGGNGYVEAHSMARLYREAPLNSIWEGSGNVICLDVLRAMAREPEAVEALRGELTQVAGQDRRYDELLKSIESNLAQPETMEVEARRLVEMIALALQGSILLQHGNSDITQAFMESRMSGSRFGCFGSLPASVNLSRILERTAPSSD